MTSSRVGAPLIEARNITKHHDYGVDLLVSDRFEFMRAFPQIPCDRVSIDDYMALVLKGTVLHPRDGVQKGGDAR